MQNDLNDKLNILKTAYLKKLETIVIELEEIIQAYNEKSIETIYSIVHKISGTSGIYGLKQISEISTEIETILKENKANPKKTDYIKERCISYIQKIKKQLTGEENV